MKEIIKVRINDDGVTATEVNPEGKEPKIKNYQAIDAGCVMVTNQRLFQSDRKAWQEAELKLRAFEISAYRSSLGGFFIKVENIHIDNLLINSGKIVQAEILDNDKPTIRIL